MSTTPDPAAIFAGIFGGGIFVILAVGVIGTLLNYLFIKAAVRNGVIEAIKKTGLNSGTAPRISGYPPASGYAAPAAPIAETPPYNPYEF